MNFEPNRGRAAELLALVDDALADGVDVTLDSYPYLPGATMLSAVLPSWTATHGPAAFLASLWEPAVRERLRHELEEVGTDGCHGCITEWDTIQISDVRNAALEGYVGRRIDEIAVSEEQAPSEVFFRILREDDMATTILQHVGDEDNVRAIMRHPVHCGGSDGILVGGRPHPRSWGTFPRYLARYVRELGALAAGVHPPPHRAAGPAPAPAPAWARPRGVPRRPRALRLGSGPRCRDVRRAAHPGRGHSVGSRQRHAGHRGWPAHRGTARPGPAPH